VRVSAELRRALGERGIERLADAIGLAHRPPAPAVPEEPDVPGDVPVEEPVGPRPVAFEEAR
jgi:hypothetical protein